MDYSKFVTKRFYRIKPQLLRDIGLIYTDAISRGEKMISLGGGMPNSETFPIKEYSFTLGDGSTLTFDTADMEVAQQYTATVGVPSLRTWAYKLQKSLHNPPTIESVIPDMRYTIQFTNGSQEGVCQIVVVNKSVEFQKFYQQALEVMVNEGDDILVQTPLSNDVISAIRPLGCNIIPIPCDKNGIIPELLRNLIESRRGTASPKLIYCCPTGNNPTGCTLSAARRHKLYALARENDLVIIEHDPYYHIKKLNYPPSLLSLDTDGRVVRIDSFSSTVSPGMRLGMVSGPKAIIQPIEFHLSTSSMHVSSLTQLVFQKLLDKWEIKGFIRHCQTISFLYESQKSLCKQMLQEHLLGLCEWEDPDCGAFLWLKLKCKSDVSPEQIDPEIFATGKHFFPNRQDDVGTEFIRVCFSSATVAQMEKSFSNLAAQLRRNGVE